MKSRAKPNRSALELAHELARYPSIESRRGDRHLGQELELTRSALTRLARRRAARTTSSPTATTHSGMSRSAGSWTESGCRHAARIPAYSWRLQSE